MEKNSSIKKYFDRISVSSVAFSILIVIAVLHIIIIMLFIDVNQSSRQLAYLVQSSGQYQIEATSLLERNVTFSETCRNYVQMPVLPDGSVNTGPLKAYAKQIEEMNNASSPVESFMSYNVSNEVILFIEQADNYSAKMFETQNHAISLIKSVYPLPPDPALSAIPDVPLTKEELAMTADERVTAAQQLILDKDYASLRYKAANSVDSCNQTLRREFAKASADAERRVLTDRLLLWITASTIILVLSFAFVMFYKFIIKPIKKYSDEIDENKKIEQVRAINELRRLVNAHNDQWDRRNKLEAILRSAAEIDTLTGLPNRYCLQQYLIEQEAFSGSIGVLLFDINDLKKTNDTKGHMAGDQLIRTAAECIRECFSQKDTNTCYRIGGDEFVAILTNCDENEIKRRIEHFEMALNRENITVSVGYAYTDETNFNIIKSLMETADKKMYEQKRHFHEEYGRSSL